MRQKAAEGKAFGRRSLILLSKKDMERKTMKKLMLAAMFCLPLLSAQGQGSSFNPGLKVAGHIGWTSAEKANDKDDNFNASNDGVRLGFTYGLTGDYFI